MQKIFTVRDARNEKIAAGLAAEARAEAASAAHDHEVATLLANPQIGILGHGKARRYYVISDDGAVIESRDLDALAREIAA